MTPIILGLGELLHHEYGSNDDVSLGKYGLGTDLDNDILLARSYLLTLYGKKMIGCTSSDKPASQLPPTEDAFAQHVMRYRLMVSV